MTNISQIPSEILVHIGSFLDNPTNASLVSRLFKATVSVGAYEVLYKCYKESLILSKGFKVLFKAENIIQNKE
ncbi:MAG TPA: hypothetical protein VHA52_05620 [Candidatus Babeliaceae bacterium]|nr:hypothetical protein [Candidatus Babeliaceae bacterium]